MSGLSLGTCVSNLKSVALTVLNWSDWLIHCAQTHRQMHIEWKQYLHHSLCLPGRDNKALLLITTRKVSYPPRISSIWLYRQQSLQFTKEQNEVLLSNYCSVCDHQRHQPSKVAQTCEIKLKQNLNKNLFYFSRPSTTLIYYSFVSALCTCETKRWNNHHRCGLLASFICQSKVNQQRIEGQNSSLSLRSKF